MMRLLAPLVALWARVTAVWRRDRLARDIDEEVAFHLSMRAADRDDLTPDEAARLARRRFGNVTRLTEDTRDMWTFPSFESFLRDVRFALRTLRRAPGFTTVAIVALAIGIGANTAVFSLVDAMTLRGLPYPDADRLVVLVGTVQRAEVERRFASYPDYLDWRAQARSVSAMAAYDTASRTLTAPGDPEQLTLEAVSPAYFDLLGVTPIAGRAFRPDEDDVAGGNPVVVLSHGLWTRRFDANPAIAGTTIRLGAMPFEVIGVMPAGFRGVTDTAELWIPFTMTGLSMDNRGNRWFPVLARLAPGVTVSQAQAEFDGISRALEAEYPQTNEARGVEVSPLAVETFGQVTPMVQALVVAVAFVLLLACANVANLLISRSEAREREIAVRSALGAGRARLLRQLVTESLVLSALGAAAGLALAVFAVRSLVASSPVALPSYAVPSMSVPVLLFTIAVTLACGLLLGLAPAMHARASRLGDALKAGARGSTGGARLRGALVAVEVALAVVLLAGAGLMIRTVQNLSAIDPGFETDAMLTFTVSVPRGQTPAADGAPPPFVVSPRDLLERLEAVPGVASAALSSDRPLTGGGSAVFYSAEGDTNVSPETRPRAYVHRVTPGFFDTMGMPLLHGRTFLDAELSPDSPAIVVSEGVVRRFWPGQDPIGKRVKPGAPNSPVPWFTIVGVVPETKYRGLPDNPTADPDLYFPYTERGVQGVLLRTSVDPASVTGAVRAAVRELDRTIVLYGVSTMAELVAGYSAQSQFLTWVMGVFAATALLLSAVGIYGVMAYLVTQRRREFGIRLALGAAARDILGVVLAQGLRLVAIGLLLGVAAAVALARFLEALLYGVRTSDPTSALAVAVLAAVAVMACLIPALRATRTDPVIALRAD